MRKIPTSMATQHPDNAAKPYWYSRSFIPASAETKECYLCFSDLGIDEYNWDWEGKFVDEAVIDRLLNQYYFYFRKHPLGKEKFLTFRIPNPRVEKQFRVARAFMVIITSAQLARSLGFLTPPIFEVILPLTETAEEILEIQEAFCELLKVEHRLLKMDESIKYIEIIPLFEQVEKIIYSDKILKKYLLLHQRTFGKKPDYLRPYCARSDPALNAGLVPTMLAIKVALSSYLTLEKEEEIKIFPMIGTGSFPFRGSVRPDSIENAISEYAGVRTLILQSAFRYDYEKKLVQKAVLELKEKLPKTNALKLEKITCERIKRLIPSFKKAYQNSIEKLAPFINHLSHSVAKRRERMLHIGLFGYSRGIGKVRLPRAIPFCASLYSLGVPPEFIGTGRGVKKSKEKGFFEEIKNCYLYFKEDLIFAGNFLNKENLLQLAKRYNFWYEILEDIKILEKELKVSFGPHNSVHFEHYRLTQKIYQRLKEGKDISTLITLAGRFRKSLG